MEIESETQPISTQVRPIKVADKLFPEHTLFGRPKKPRPESQPIPNNVKAQVYDALAKVQDAIRVLGDAYGEFGESHRVLVAEARKCGAADRVEAVAELRRFQRCIESEMVRQGMDGLLDRRASSLRRKHGELVDDAAKILIRL